MNIYSWQNHVIHYMLGPGQIPIIRSRIHLAMYVMIILPVLCSAVIFKSEQRATIYSLMRCLSCDMRTFLVVFPVTFLSHCSIDFITSSLIGKAAVLNNVLNSPCRWDQIIIVDDGSTDKTVEIAYEYVKAHGIDRIRVLKQVVNQGKGAAVRKVFTSYFGFSYFYYQIKGWMPYSPFLDVCYTIDLWSSVCY